MKKSTVNLVTALKAKLLEFPTIVNSLERKEPNFMNQLFLWINQSEEILSTYNISEVSELAGLRSKIIAPKYADTKSISIKKLQLKIAAESLFDIQHIVLNVLNPKELKIEECRELIIQLLNIVSQTQAIKYNSSLPFDHLINDIWQFIVSNDQLKAGAIKLKTSLIMTDIHLLIAEELNLNDF
jgi:hypothetical protein